MILSFFLICALLGLGAVITNETFFVTLTFRNYQIYLSVFTFVGMVLGIVWLWNLLLLPFRLFRKFSLWRQQSKQDQKRIFLASVLEALANQNKEQYPLLVKQALHHFKKEEVIYWVILSLLQPSEEVYQKLLTFPSTVLGGIYGFLNMAEGMGNTTEMRNLLDSLPEKQRQVLWVKQAYFQLSLMEGDWEQACQYLETLKKVMPKSEYKRSRACCLMMMGQVDKAYKLDDTQAPIVLAKAKENPEKALKILNAAWKKTPCQEIYNAFKSALSGKTDEEKMKAVKALVKQNKGNRFSLLALADMNLETGNAPKAKDILEEYLENFPLTQQVALMMAKVERQGWKHEEAALDWEKKALNLQEKTGWICTHCGHQSGKWEPVCPACHLFNGMIPN
ncbi:MAG: tetratricopeptide repeat protein [Alphaproteobacteria bacterium]|nr:tetratricopeptide repeat protein [Alphaproteobacteria bacterium]